MSKMKKAHQTGVWKNQPIGGEFRPEGQSAFLSGTPLDGYQDYSECVNATHCSWLMMAGAFEENLGADGPTVIVTSSASGRTACSSLYYEPEYEPDWCMVFYKKPKDDIEFELI